jgi:hypothetical protein
MLYNIKKNSVYWLNRQSSKKQGKDKIKIRIFDLIVQLL